MRTGGSEGIESGSEVAVPASQFRLSSINNAFRSIFPVHRRGSRSLINLSLYAAGLSGMWTALGTPILPIKIEEILANGGSTILGITFDEDNKNGALGLVSLAGLAIAAVAQPIAGMLSDKRTGPGKRMPFLLAGTVGMVAGVLLLGLPGTLIALILLNLFIQGMGNFGQGAANGLIADHVDKGSKGAAAGALNLSRVVGAGVLTAIVLWMMSHYDADTAPGWLMASLLLMATVAILTTLWTVTSLWRGGAYSDFVDPESVEEPVEEPSEEDEEENGGPQVSYFRFLVALTVVITGFSALQLYSFFYLEDVIGLDNPSQGGLYILLAISITTALTVIPAGRLTDRIGRDPMLYAGGVLGVMATLILIFAGSLVVVTLVGVLVGAAIGIFLTVSWALANDLVSKRHAARDLGYASVAILIGSTASRISGLGVDRLNQEQDALGYQVVLGAVAFCFLVTVALMTRLDPDEPSGPSGSLHEQPAAD